jgi:hypothetical protein
MLKEKCQNRKEHNDYLIGFLCKERDSTGQVSSDFRSIGECFE